MTDRESSARTLLEAHGQSHLLRFAAELPAAGRAALLDEIESIDFIELDALIAAKVRESESVSLPDDLAPAPYYPCDPDDPSRPYDAARYREAGIDLIRRGKVAAFTVAGGQGTRLGWRGPKGSYPATVVTGKPLFRCFAEQILAAERKYGVTIPWYIMTSPVNDEETRGFFQDNNCFGLTRKNIVMFPQGMMPSLDAATGRILLAEKGRLAMNPDGHGGAIKALRESGALEDMRARGIELISYFQVDNPAARAIDPLFVGLHRSAPDSSGQMSSKMVAKASPEEKVGVFGVSKGKLHVIEYSDLPEALARETDAKGRLKYLAGSIAIHLLGVDFVEQLTAEAHHFALPYHRALKSVPYVDLETGTQVISDAPNAVKLETFVFDAIPLAEASIVLETSRVEEFAPIKNARGADSPATSHAIQSDRAGRWLAAHGVTVPFTDDGHVAARIEISPLTALEAADLAGADLPASIGVGEEIVL